MSIFSLQHLLWLSLTTLFVGGCIGMGRLRLDSHWHGALRASLFVIVLLNESWWFIYRHTASGVALVDNLPLHLCDMSVFLMLITLATGNKCLAELSYYAGVTGALLAVCVPAITETGAIRLLAEIRYFVAEDSFRAGGAIDVVGHVTGRYDRLRKGDGLCGPFQVVHDRNGDPRGIVVGSSHRALVVGVGRRYRRSTCQGDSQSKTAERYHRWMAAMCPLL